MGVICKISPLSVLSHFSVFGFALSTFYHFAVWAFGGELFVCFFIFLVSPPFSQKGRLRFLGSLKKGGLAAKFPEPPY